MIPANPHGTCTGVPTKPWRPGSFPTNSHFPLWPIDNGAHPILFKNSLFLFPSFQTQSLTTQSHSFGIRRPILSLSRDSFSNLKSLFPDRIKRSCAAQSNHLPSFGLHVKRETTTRHKSLIL